MRKTRLKPVSKQKSADNVKYRQAKEEWREERIEADGYHRCAFVGKPLSSPGAVDQEGRCILFAMPAPHHKKRRTGPLLYDKRWFCSLCYPHHSWVHQNGREARKRGLILWK